MRINISKEDDEVPLTRRAILKRKLRQKKLVFHFNSKYEKLATSGVITLKKIEQLTRISDVVVIEVDYLTFRYLQAEEDESPASPNVGSTGGGEELPAVGKGKLKGQQSRLPSQLHLLVKYAMDVCVVEDKEFHLAVFVDSQLSVEELSRALKRPVGGALADEDAEDTKTTEELAADPDAAPYRYLAIVKNIELIVGALPSEGSSQEAHQSAGSSDQPEGGSEEDAEDATHSSSQEIDLSNQVDRVLKVIYNRVEQYDKEIDEEDAEQVIDRQVSIESKAIP